jgi:protein-L-isoaspartate(D-aspartate) O-methyltransferase
MSTSNQQMIALLKQAGVLRRPALEAAFRIIDRKNFVPAENQTHAYRDKPLSIGYSQTISQPFTVAFMLELLTPQSGQKILDIGSGSGWSTALLAQLVGTSGHVYGTELIPELVTLGQQNIAKYSSLTAKITSASETLGLPAEAPFDRILVSAAAKTLPYTLVRQLKIDGVLVLPIGDSIFCVRRQSKTQISTEQYAGFSFVPLITKTSKP